MRSVLRRPVLLLSAAATVAVPGALAALAVLGHQHEGAAAGPPPASLGAAARAGQQAAGLPAGAGAASGDGAGRPAPDIRAAAPSGDARDLGARLLKEAAAAGSSATYQGVEAIADTTLAGPGMVVARVWHRGGGRTVTQLAGGQPQEAYDGGGRDPEGVFGVTATLVGLLEKHYVPLYLGTGSLIGRPALMVAVERADGSTAARYWLDARTLLPLRRDVYDPSARLVSDERFTQVRFGPAAMPRVVAGPGPATWAPAPSPARLLSRLNGEGSLLPRTLPGDLSLYAASDVSTSSGQVADFGFSDGLSVVSLFVERGSLPARMPGWQPERVSRHLVYAAQDEVTMSGRGFVYTLVYDAPSSTVEDVVGALPANGSPGILVRLGRGLGRLVSVLDPFR